MFYVQFVPTFWLQDIAGHFFNRTGWYYRYMDQFLSLDQFKKHMQ